MHTYPHALFSVFGIEIEYMIVDKDSLMVRPIADILLKTLSGGDTYVNDVVLGPITCSNELVKHVIEFKVTDPITSFATVADDFQHALTTINTLLAPHNAMILGTGMHPLMLPREETVIWEHSDKEIYDWYDRTFGCKSHGWANLQSTHINLPFKNDDEFGRLHAAIRAILPLIPALAASSPFIEGEQALFKDMRLEVYANNQKRIPCITGNIIPEAVFSKTDYDEAVFAPIKKHLVDLDPEGYTDYHFINSRGAIARFDRGAIEIRLIDAQEHPYADIAIVELVVSTLQDLVKETYSSYEAQKNLQTKNLREILNTTIREAEDTYISDAELLAVFGVSQSSITAHELWGLLIDRHIAKATATNASKNWYTIYKTEGTLTTRMLSEMMTMDTQSIASVYKGLSEQL